MRHLLLVRHAKPEIREDVPPATWELSEEGRQKSRLLSAVFEKYGVTRVFTSTEPKANMTGCIPAQLLNLPCETVSDLHEHDRSGTPFYEREVFLQKVKTFFEEPEKRSFGKESAKQAQARIVSAVDGLVAQHPDETLAIASHGTVMALYVAQKAEVDVFAFWGALAQPTVLVFALPEFDLVEVLTEFS